jgi:WD40 repeat protein
MALLMTRLSAIVVTSLALACHPAPAVRAEIPTDSGDRPVRSDLYGDPIPAGADVRRGTVRFRHQGSGWTTGVGFSHDGRTLVSGAENEILRFWDAESGKPLRTVQTGQDNLRGFAFSTDRRVVATLGFHLDEDRLEFFRTVKLWNVENGRELAAISWVEPRGSEAFAVALTPDNQTIVTGSTDGTVRFWDRASGDELLRHQLSTREITALAVSPDGELVAAGGDRGTFLWEWAAGNEPVRLADRGRIQSLAFSPDGKLLAFGADGGSDVQLWSVPERRLVRNLTSARRGVVKAVAFSPDGKRLASTDYQSNSVRLWDVESGENLWTIETAPDYANSLTFSPDGRRIAAGLSDAVVRVWDAETGDQVAAQPHAHRGGVSAVAFTPRDLVVTASDDGTVRVWNATTGRQEQMMKHDKWVRAMAVSPHGDLAASSSLDDTVRIWETITGKEVHRLAGHGQVGGRRALAFTPDGRQLVSWGDDLRLRLWDVATGALVQEHALRPSGIDIPDDPQAGEHHWRFGLGHGVMSPDATHFVLTYNQTVYLCDVETGQELQKYSTELSLADLAVSPDGRFLLVAGRGRGTETRLADGGALHSSARNHAVKLLTLATGEELWNDPLPAGGAGSVAFSNDGKLMAAALRRPYSEIRVWTVESQQRALTIENVPAIGWHRSLAFSRDGNRLACGQMDTTVLIWGLDRLGKGRRP